MERRYPKNLGTFLRVSWVFSGASVKILFGEFRLDAESRQLFRSERAIHLAPKAFQLLKLLVDNRPRAVSY